MKSTNLCTPILINDSTCKTVAIAYAAPHMNNFISSIPYYALISIAIRRVDKTRSQYIIHVNIEHCT